MTTLSKPRSPFLNAVSITLALFAMSPRPAMAVTANWTCADAFWDNITCWSTQPTFPGAGDDVVIGDNELSRFDGVLPATTVLSITIDGAASSELRLSGSSLTATNETVGLDAFGTLTQTGGTHTITNQLIVGSNNGSNGTYSLSGSAMLTAVEEYIGNVGTGVFNQSGGTHTVTTNSTLAASPGTGTYNHSSGLHSVTNRLDVGLTGGGSGTYTLSGTGDLTTNTTRVGISGTGTFNQSGGMHTIATDLSLGTLSGGNGTYNLTGGTLSIGGGIVNGAGTGTFNSDGGTLSVGSGSIDVDFFGVGWAPGTNGSHTLSGSDTLTTTFSTSVGGEGTGTLTQNGGTTSVGLFLFLGLNGSGNGTYNLNGGSLTTGNTAVGNIGAGVFNHSGGMHTVFNELVLGRIDDVSANGTYTLGGSGILTTDDTTIGTAGTGAFIQNGGTHTVINNVTVGSTGTYNLTSGDLSAQRVFIEDGGSFTQSGGTNDINIALFADDGTYNLSGGGSLTSVFTRVGLDSGASGTFNQIGGTHAVNETLFLGIGTPGGDGGNGNYVLDAGNLTTGATTVGSNGNGTSTFTQNGGIHTITQNAIPGPGVTTADLTLGADVSNGIYNLNGGLLIVGGDIVNGTGTGTLNIDGGTLTAGVIDVDTFVVGSNTGRVGSHTLATGSLTTGYTGVGLFGTGTLTQTGVTHTVGGVLELGSGTTGDGTYDLSGASSNLTTLATFLGFEGTGTFNQSAGTYDAGNELVLGYLDTGDGTYNLSGAGSSLTTTNAIVGLSGDGTFTQADGTHTVGGDLSLGLNGTGDGTYNLFGGTLDVAGNIVNGAGSSTLFIVGGTLAMNPGNSIDVDVFAVGVSGNPGDHTLDGGTLTATTEAISNGSFSQSGGTNQVNGEFSVAGNGLSASYVLDGGGSLISTNAIIGKNGGTGSFTLNDGTHVVGSGLTIGDGAFVGAADGAYTLNGGSLTALVETIGRSDGVGTFTQTGGTHNVTNTLTVGFDGFGTYDLGGPGSMLITSATTIGSPSAFLSTFTQTDGTHAIANDLTLGDATYNLDGGALNVTGDIVNDAGQGTFNIDGGVLNVGGNIDVDALNIGTASGGNGSLIVADPKTFTAGSVNIGGAGMGALAVDGTGAGAALETNIIFVNSNGSAMVDGPSATLNLGTPGGPGFIFVDEGTLHLTDGASLTASPTDDNSIIQQNGGSVTVAGGAQIDGLRGIFSQTDGTGISAPTSLTIQDPGTIVNLNGDPGMLGVGTGLLVGWGSEATASVLSGAMVSIEAILPDTVAGFTVGADAPAAIFGFHQRSNALFDVDGAGTRVDVAGDGFIGSSTGLAGLFGFDPADESLNPGGDGELNITGGAQVTLTGDVVVADAPMSMVAPISTGSIIVSGMNSLLEIGNHLALGTAVTTPEGTSPGGGLATLTIEDEGSVIANSLGVGANATVNLTGGTLTTGTFESLGGTFNFTAGTFELTNSDLDIGPNGLLGPAVGLSSLQSLSVSGTTRLIGASTLSLNGGTFSTGALVNNGGAFLNSGTFNLTNDDLVIGAAGLFGNVMTLGFNQTINVTNNVTIDPGALLYLPNGSFGGGTVTNNGEVQLDGALATLGGGTVVNNGRISGNGRVNATLANAAGGELRANFSDRLLLAGAGNTNDGLMNVNFGGTIESPDGLTNSATGTIAGDGVIRVGQITYTPGVMPTPAGTGLFNEGSLNFSGTTKIFGDVWTQGGNDSDIIVSGGAVLTFFEDVFMYDDPAISGRPEIRAGFDSTVVYFGTLKGDINKTGPGLHVVEGLQDPGFSPGHLSGSNEFWTDSSTNGFDLAGTTAVTPGLVDKSGTHSVFSYSGMLTIAAGATIDIDLIGVDGPAHAGTPFAPVLGDSFEILYWATLVANTSSVNFDFDDAGLASGLVWKTIWGPDSNGSLTLEVAAVPLPTPFVLMLSALAAIAWRRRTLKS